MDRVGGGGGRIRWSGDGAATLDDVGPRCMEVVGGRMLVCVMSASCWRGRSSQATPHVDGKTKRTCFNISFDYLSLHTLLIWVHADPNRLRNSVLLYGRTSFKRLRDYEVALLGVSNAPKMTF